MKKKLALLLALSMILSMVPVTAFGEGRAIYTLGDPANVSEDMGDNYTVVVAVKSSAFRPYAVSSGQSLGIIVSQNEDAFLIRGASIFDYGSATLNNGKPTDANPGDTVYFNSAKKAVEITKWDQMGVNETAYDLYVQLEIEILDHDPDEYFVDFITDNTGSTVISGVTIDSALVAKKAGSWTIKGGDQVFFADIATLNPITIKETVARQFAYDPLAGTTDPETISLVLPYGYAWMTNGNWTFPDGAATPAPATAAAVSNANFLKNNISVSDAQKRFINPTVTSAGGLGNAITGTSDDNRVLTFTLSRTPGADYVESPGTFTVKNLRFVASDDARMGDIDIKVYRGGYGASVPRERDMDDPSDTLEKIANYSNYGLVITEDDEDDMAELISGTFDVSTSAFTITELTPNSFPTSRTETLGARFDAPEGVQFTAAHVWFGVAGSSSPIIGGGKKLIDDATRYQVGDPPDGNGVRLTADSLYISPPMDRRNTKDVYTMSIYFDVSIIPGFVGPDDDFKEINISFEGTILDTKEIPVYESDKKTAFGKKEIAVATVVDRITVDADKASIDESNAGLYIRDIAVNNIVIKETDVGMLELNTELWVFVDSPRSGDITFSAGQPYADAESGLRVSRSTKLDIPELPTGIRFTITRESNGVPGTITVPGGLISGFLYPRVDYEIVVTGDAVGMSQDVVNYYDNTLLGAGSPANNTLSQYVRINPYPALFEKSLYKTALFSYTGDTLLDAPGEPGTGVADGTSKPKVESMSFGSDTIMTSDGPLSSPFRTNLPGTVGDTGYLALRAFELLNFEVTWLGGNTSKIYDPYTKQTLTYYIGSEVGYLDGAPVTFVNNDGVPAKVLQATVDGEVRTFLPARTVASLFGYEVSCPAPYTTVYLNLIN